MSLAPSPFSQIGQFLARKGRRVWSLSATEKTQLTARMTRLRFWAQDLHELYWSRGQDLVLELPRAQGDIVRRHYTIRQHDRDTLTIDVFGHGSGEAANWLSNLKIGDTIDATGPRGHVTLRQADWHLFVGDETCIAAIFAMVEGIERSNRAFAFIEIADSGEIQSLKSDARIEWIVRQGEALTKAVEAFDLPSGRGHAYIIGETSKVRTIRHRLLERGLGKDMISAEGYWRPGRLGGHDHI